MRARSASGNVKEQVAKWPVATANMNHGFLSRRSPAAEFLLLELLDALSESPEASDGVLPKPELTT